MLVRDVAWLTPSHLASAVWLAAAHPKKHWASPLWSTLLPPVKLTSHFSHQLSDINTTGYICPTNLSVPQLETFSFIIKVIRLKVWENNAPANKKKMKLSLWEQREQDTYAITLQDGLTCLQICFLQPGSCQNPQRPCWASAETLGRPVKNEGMNWKGSLWSEENLMTLPHNRRTTSGKILTLSLSHAHTQTHVRFNIFVGTFHKCNGFKLFFF